MSIEFSSQALAPLLLGLLILPLIIFWGANRAGCWSLAKVISGANLAAALVCWFAVLQTPLSIGVLHLGFVQATVLLLVSFLGWIVYRYAASNFQRDNDGPRFLRWLALTLLAVHTLLLVDHLVLFWMAWVAVSLSLHQLLLFYPDRPRALLAAHKKFLIARVSELLLAVAIGLIYHQFGSFSLSYTMGQVAGLPAGDIPWQLVVAASCLVLVALLKCAQLPLHGWLIQVVESPTPVRGSNPPRSTGLLRPSRASIALAAEQHCACSRGFVCAFVVALYSLRPTRILGRSARYWPSLCRLRLPNQ